MYVKKLEKLGEGTYGNVYKGRIYRTGKLCAIKEYKQFNEIQGIMSTTLREVSILKKLNHPNIVEMICSDYINHKVIVLFEYISRDLKSVIENTKPRIFSKKLIMKLSYELTSAMSYLHCNSLLHRDLKPQNILLTRDYTLKLCDFGLSREFKLPATSLTDEVITLWYRAPEIILGTKIYTTAIDVWSVGCIIAELALGRPLFCGECIIHHLYCIFQVLGTPKNYEWNGIEKMKHFKKIFPKFRAIGFGEILTKRLGFNGIHLLSQILTLDPGKRKCCKEALDHFYFKNYRNVKKKIRKNLNV